jgi:hypothetical protein
MRADNTLPRAPLIPSIPAVIGSEVRIVPVNDQQAPLRRGVTAALVSCDAAAGSCTVHVSGTGQAVVPWTRMRPPQPNVSAVAANTHPPPSSAAEPESEPEPEPEPETGCDEVLQRLRDEVLGLTLSNAAAVTEKDEREGLAYLVTVERDEVKNQLEVRICVSTRGWLPGNIRRVGHSRLQPRIYHPLHSAA